MTPSSMGWFAHPPIRFHLWDYRNSNSRTPCYLFSGLPAHSSSTRLQQRFGFHTRSILVTVGLRSLAHFSRLTVGAALLTPALLHAQQPAPNTPQSTPTGQPVTAAPADPAIAAALQQVSPD